MEEWIDFDEVFFRHSSEAQDQQEHQDHDQDHGHGHEQSHGRALDRRMSIFQVKCALIALFGEEVPTVSNVSTYTSHRVVHMCCVVLCCVELCMCICVYMCVYVCVCVCVCVCCGIIHYHYRDGH